MKLLFDLKATQPNLSGKRHGGGRYGEIIFFRMLERNISFSCFYDSNLWINPLVLNACQKHNVLLYDIKNQPINELVKNNHVNRVYSCLPDKKIIDLNCEIYGTIHGLREFEVPVDDFFYKYRSTYKEWIKFTIRKFFQSRYRKMRHQKFVEEFVKNNFHPITVSEHSYYSLLTYIPELKNVDIPVYYSPNTSSDSIPQSNNKGEKYVLLVSGNRWEKNNLRAIIAFDKLVTNGMLGNDIRMKVTGAKQMNFKYRLENPDRFDFLGYVDDAVLDNLYANAYLFVYPSLNEGFGYPPLEAMRYKVPVISSAFASMAEVCAGGALFFNPLSIEEIMNRMMMMMNEDIRAVYSIKGYNQYLQIKERQKQDLDLLIDYIMSE